MKKVINDLFDYENYKIVQSQDSFKFSLDSILLAEFVEIVNKNDKILDMCTGNVPVPLILSSKVANKIIGFEIQKEIYEMAIESIAINNKENQISVINDDINNIHKYFPGNNFDIITCNPPFFKSTTNKLINQNDIKAIARHEIKIDLDGIIKVASQNLNNKGSFYLVHRSERIDEIICLCTKYNLTVKKIQPIVTTSLANPSIVLIKAIKNGGYSVKLMRDINVDKLETYQGLFTKKEI